jgi:hypothetical protein
MRPARRLGFLLAALAVITAVLAVLVPLTSAAARPAAGNRAGASRSRESRRVRVLPQKTCQLQKRNPPVGTPL